MFMVIIEGNIGSGKSTLAEKLATLMEAKLYKEPVDDNPYLKPFYKEPKKYAFLMQLYLLDIRFRMHVDGWKEMCKTLKPVIFDRSYYGDAMFAKQNYLCGNMTNEEYEMYMRVRNTMSNYLHVPHITIYLNTDPKIAKERILKRGRDCEKGIPIEYLQGLSDLYKGLIFELGMQGSHVLEYNWNEPMNELKVLADIEEVTDRRVAKI